MVETLLHKSFFQHIGKRPHQEDQCKLVSPFAQQRNLLLAVVCDGHAGSQASQFLMERFIAVLSDFISNCKQDGVRQYTTFMRHALRVCVDEWDAKCFGSDLAKIVDQKSKKAAFDARDTTRWESEGLESGSTLCTVLIDFACRQMHVLNLGDSRAAWVCSHKTIGETVDHKVRMHMPSVPGYTFSYGDGRIEDDLGMARAFGDNTFALFRIVSREPDVFTIDFGDGEARIVIATDGLWDWVKTQTVLYESYDDATALVQQNVSEFDDNITVIYMRIGAGIAPSEPPKEIDTLPTCARGRSRAVSPKRPLELKSNPHSSEIKRVEMKEETKATYRPEVKRVEMTEGTKSKPRTQSVTRKKPLASKMTQEEIDVVLAPFVASGKQNPHQERSKRANKKSNDVDRPKSPNKKSHDKNSNDVERPKSPNKKVHDKKSNDVERPKSPNTKLGDDKKSTYVERAKSPKKQSRESQERISKEGKKTAERTTTHSGAKKAPRTRKSANLTFDDLLQSLK
jgi:serine/threonine protein phosphatase PrpC